MKLLLTMIATLGLSIAANAADKGDGCGLGWEVTTERTMIATTTRGTTNSVVPPTFGMTSGTLGCDQHPIADKDIPAARYAVTNFDVLKHEMAMGSGETLSGLANIMGCDDNFSQLTQSNYSQIVNNANPVQMFKNLQAVTAKACLM